MFALRIAEKAAINSLDDEKAAYKDSLKPDVEDSSVVVDESVSDESDEGTENADGNSDIIITISVIVVAVVILGALIFFVVKKKANYND